MAGESCCAVMLLLAHRAVRADDRIRGRGHDASTASAGWHRLCSQQMAAVRVVRMSSSRSHGRLGLALRPIN